MSKTYENAVPEVAIPGVEKAACFSADASLRGGVFCSAAGTATGVNRNVGAANVLAFVAAPELLVP